MKSSVYPAVICASLLGLVVLVLGLLQFTISIEPIEPETWQETVPSKSRQPSVSGKRSPSGVPFSTVPTPAPKPTESVKPNTSPVSQPAPANLAAGQGALRVSNQTDQPVRVALLAQGSALKSADGQPNYGEPAHWDFAPGEGSSQGLILSLPQGELQLKKGDILAAFTQDGSGRYWGPYVVGETTSPIWNRQASEWQLILKP